MAGAILGPGETCPVFPSNPEPIRSSFADPATAAGQEARLHAFERTATELTTRISYLLLLIHDRGYPLAQMADAHRYVDQGHKKGNVAVTVAH